MIVKRVGLVLLLASVVGCATKYQAQGLSGGFDETRLSETIFRVSFRGNGFTTPDRAADLALLRSAELTLQHGFTHFIIIDSQHRVEQSTMTTPTQTYTNGTASVYGRTAYVNSTSTTYGGQTTTTVKPASTNTIVCYKGKPDLAGIVYDAQFLYNSLTAKYGVK